MNLLQIRLVIWCHCEVTRSVRSWQIVMANCLEGNLWCFGGQSSVCCYDVFERPFGCEHLWFLPHLFWLKSLGLQVCSLLVLRVQQRLLLMDWSFMASDHVKYYAYAVNSHQYIDFGTPEEISWKEFWKCKVSPLHCHTRHSWDSVAVSYTLDYWCSWDDVAYLCMSILFYPHLSVIQWNEVLTNRC